MSDEEKRPDRIVRWAQGAFQTWDRPTWWDGVLERFWKGAKDAIDPLDYFGPDNGYQVRVYSLGAERGSIAIFDNPFTSYEVWLRDEADLMDLVTTRVPAWINLPSDETIVTSLERIANTLIGYARHGEGEHVSVDGSKNRIDLRREREEIDRLTRSMKRQAPPAGSTAE